MKEEGKWEEEEKRKRSCGYHDTAICLLKKTPHPFSSSLPFKFLRSYSLPYSSSCPFL